MVCCSAAACGDVPHLESLSHVFMLHCPVVQPAVVWPQDLWARLVPGSRLPLDARVLIVLIAGDHTVWDPGVAAAGVELWAHLRLIFCMSSGLALSLTCGAAGWPMVRFVVALTAAAWTARVVRLAWMRVSTDLAGATTTLPSWCAIRKRFDPSQADFPSAGAVGNIMCWLMCPLMRLD